jgi:hypothetical protein
VFLDEFRGDLHAGDKAEIQAAAVAVPEFPPALGPARSSRLVDHARKDQPAVLAAQDRFGGAFGVRHHASDIAARVADARNLKQ